MGNSLGQAEGRTQFIGMSGNGHARLERSLKQGTRDDEGDDMEMVLACHVDIWAHEPTILNFTFFRSGINVVPKYMKAPIYIYYQLDNYYQNHRRFSRGTEELKVNRKNIAWKSDRDHKFGKQVYPFNFQNGTLIGGGNLDPNIPLSDQEDLIVWMRTAALPSFRKLYGKIEEDLDVDDVVVVNLLNNYNTYSFGGKKKLVLSTSSWLGGKNHFLGMAYLSVGLTGTQLIYLGTGKAFLVEERLKGGQVSLPLLAPPSGTLAKLSVSRQNNHPLTPQFVHVGSMHEPFKASTTDTEVGGCLDTS
ncbi:hypothetical protein TEA_012350 [Camellia sinensis var. sinensis]|uniref:ALA-interacting subunit n=1 Tax=Camellia sinensis var. sinensis TaxID=542762 RepID=A0A4S4DHW0_CAMSN|nr:hypothetical protein TEA_012350 [Camellia sinensis var. sinensis]